MVGRNGGGLMPPELLLYKLSRRGVLTHSQIICRSHYEEMTQPGNCMEPLSTREQGAGMTQTVTPYTTGDRPCEVCEADAREQQQRSA